jgi:hypothetical protein
MISAGGSHTCALTSAGAVECWGGNLGSGQLGDGTMIDRYKPVVVSGLGSGVTVISAGGSWYDGRVVGHSCALTNTGRAKCWGANYDGQLGDGTTILALRPLGVIGFGGSLKCAMPAVLGYPLAYARSAITHAHCRVGVRRVASRERKNTVVGQRPRPYTRLKKGAKVNLKVSRGR